MNSLSLVLFGPNNGVNLLTLDWNYLIILDACRCDVFACLYKQFFISKNTNFKCIKSTGSFTEEVVRNWFSNKQVLKRVRNVIFINSNPAVDKALLSLGVDLEKIFFKYIPVWKNHWDYDIGTVKPEDVFYITLKVFFKNPDKKMIIWFLQPHYPYLDERFRHLNDIGKSFMNQFPQTAYPAKKNFLYLLQMVKRVLRGRISGEVFDKLVGYLKHDLMELQKAYIYNLFHVLKYVRKLTEILPGRIMITSDHGEAFGEPLTRLFPIRVYEHVARIRILPLIEIPLLEVVNIVPREEVIAKTLRYLITKVKKSLQQGT